MKKAIWLIFGLILSVLSLGAQTTTVSSTGVVDTDSQTWAGGTYQITFVPRAGISPNAYHWNGGTMSGNTLFSGSLNGSGAFSVAIPDNSAISPSGSQWDFRICPNATSGCFFLITAVSGTTQNLTSALNALAIGPRFSATPSAYGYSTVEVNPSPQPGSLFFNVTSGTNFSWNGSTWTAVGGSGTFNALTGDATSTSTGGATTVVGVNGTKFSTLATGILKNTTTTGVPSIAVAGDFPTLNQNTTGTAANITATSNATLTTLSALSLPSTQVTGLGTFATIASGTLTNGDFCTYSSTGPTIACNSTASGAVASVANSDGTLTISPTTGNVVASIALGHANTWTALQSFSAGVAAGSSPPSVTFGTGGGFAEAEGTAPSVGVPALNVDACYADSTAHAFKCSLNNGALFTSAMNLAYTGAGAAIPTGPTTSTNGDVVTYTGTAGQIADSGTLLTALAPKASPTFTGTVTLPLTTAGLVTTTSGGVIGSEATATAAQIPAALSNTTSVNGTTIPASATLTQTIASGTATLGTAAIASGACATVVTATATGGATTDVISADFNADPTAITGYGASATGAVLSIYKYVTANTANFKVCNSTAASITPGAATLNWRIVR